MGIRKHLKQAGTYAMGVANALDILHLLSKQDKKYWMRKDRTK